ncbi:MAG: hypothetical protein AAGH64_09125 [Planctomycetota bacterium]
MRRLLTCVFCLHAALIAGGCASPSGSGIRIGDPTLEQFEAGVTKEAWVYAILGEPTDVSPVEGVAGTKVLRYSIESRRSGLMSLVNGSDPKTLSVVYFIVTDGIVTRYWADREIERTPLGQPVRAEDGSVAAG